MTELPEHCLKLITPDIRRRLKVGKTFGPFVCDNEYFTVTRDGDDALTYQRVERPTVNGVVSTVTKSCGGCGGGGTASHAPTVGDVDLREYFDIVFVLNLPRRTDRLAEITAHLSEIRFPFRAPEIFTGVDARVCPPPPFWPANQQGAWGCMESHRHMLATALSRGAKRVLIIEDDFFAAENFAAAASAFVCAVPVDWEMLYFGGQDIGRDGSRFREKVGDVYQVAGIERTHCYAVQGDMIRDLYSKLITSSGHCDHVMGPFQRGRKVFAPAEWLAGQRASKSDIGSESTERLWQPPPKDWPVTLFIGSPDGAKKYREENGLHGGHHLRGETDVGILDIMQKPPAEQRAALARWANMIEWEGRSKTPPRPAFIYGVPEALARQSIGERLQVVSQTPIVGPAVWGPQKWNELHSWPGRFDDASPLDAALEARRVRHFIDTLPCDDCRAHATALLEQCPPDVSSRKAYRLWGIELHNRVNVRIGKPEMSVEDALKRIAICDRAPTVFWHVAAMNHWREVVVEQLTMLREIGLHPRVTFLGQPHELEWLQSVSASHGVRITVEKSDPNILHYETFAMLGIQAWAQSARDDDAVMYFHTKGVSAPGHDGKRRWRHLMQDELVRKWKEHLPKLSDHDAIGCNWRQFEGNSHFCGTFWMSRADYIRTLPDFATFHAGWSFQRFSCEAWIGQGTNPRIISLAHRDVDYCSPEYFA